MSEFVRFEVSDSVATILLDRPKLNALNSQMQQEIADAARQATALPEVKAVVIYGGERSFAAGADIKEMAEFTGAEMAARSVALQECFTAVAEIPKPVVAAITGYALGGGCELALCADVRFAATDATLGLPEVQLGIMPGAGGTQRLARLVGPSSAKELIFTGRFVPAVESLEWGLVDRVVAPEEVYGQAVAWARQFSQAASVALGSAKVCIDRGLGLSLEQGLELERRHFSALFDTEDQKLGMRSFLEHGPGKANFAGR
jgi:enoyl-CoA hydratase/carnithine racemase